MNAHSNTTTISQSTFSRFKLGEGDQFNASIGVEVIDFKLSSVEGTRDLHLKRSSNLMNQKKS